MTELNKIVCERLKEEYFEYKHESGLDVYIYPKKFSGSYALFSTKYGSVDSRFKLESDRDFTEVPDGIAHFLEHKLFETEDGEETFARFAKVGASPNAYTSFTQTAYLFSCTDGVYPSLEILLDFVTHPYFTPENVAKEQGIIAQEIRMYDDNPGTNLFYGLMNCLYEKHKIATNIAGTVESIGKIDSDILYKCYSTFYHPSNMVLSVCGDVIPEKVVEIVEKYIPKTKQEKIIRDYPTESSKIHLPRYENEFQVAKPIFEIGIKDTDISQNPAERAKKAVAVDIANEIIFGRSGEFFNNLYNKGLISSEFGVSYEHNESFSFASLSGESSDPDAVYSAFLDYIEIVKKNGLSKEDFERIRRVTYSGIVKSFDSTEDIATNIVWQAFCGIDLFDYVDIIANIDIEYTESVLRSLYNPDSFALAVIRPISK